MMGRGEPVATHCMSVVVPGRRVTFVGETWESGRERWGGVREERMREEGMWEKGGGWKRVRGGRVGEGWEGGRVGEVRW